MSLAASVKNSRRNPNLIFIEPWTSGPQTDSSMIDVLQILCVANTILGGPTDTFRFLLTNIYFLDSLFDERHTTDEHRRRAGRD